MRICCQIIPRISKQNCINPPSFSKSNQRLLPGGRRRCWVGSFFRVHVWQVPIYVSFLWNVFFSWPFQLVHVHATLIFRSRGGGGGLLHAWDVVTKFYEMKVVLLNQQVKVPGQQTTTVRTLLTDNKTYKRSTREEPSSTRHQLEDSRQPLASTLLPPRLATSR